MKIAITLFVGTLLGLVISHAADPIASHLSSTPGFAGHYSNTENAGFQFQIFLTTVRIYSRDGDHLTNVLKGSQD